MATMITATTRCGSAGSPSSRRFPHAKHAKKKRDCQGEQPRFKTGDLMIVKRPDAKSVPGRFSSGSGKFLADDFAQRHQILGKQADAFG